MKTYSINGQDPISLNDIIEFNSDLEKNEIEAIEDLSIKETFYIDFTEIMRVS